LVLTLIGMEKGLNQVAAEALTKASGYMCIDKKGLVLSSSGSANKESAPVFASLCQMAMDLEPGTSPLLVLDTPKSKILIQGKEQLVTVLYRDKQ